jgi:CBS-domain-containing membrane protein
MLHRPMGIQDVRVTAVISGSVARIMRQSFVTAAPDETLNGASQTMRLARLRHLLVTQGDHLVGILSYREILEGLLEIGVPRSGGRVGDAMRRAPAFATPQTTLAEAADRMCRYGLGCLPVLEPSPGAPPEAGRLVGIITEADLLRAAYAPVQPASRRAS